MRLTLEPIITINADLARELVKLGLTTDDFQQSEQRFFTATFNGKHVAFAAFTPAEKADTNNNQLVTFVVHKATRRRGVGLFLLTQLIERVGGRFECDFSVVNAEDSDIAKRFLAACGFSAADDPLRWVTG